MANNKLESLGAMNNLDQQTSPALVSQESINASRRRLNQTLLTAPIVASLAARPALANQACSISGFLSGDISPNGHIYTCGGYGCTPGFWKNNPEAWAHTPYSPGSCKRAQGGHCKEWNCNGGTTLQAILPTSCGNPFTAINISEPLLSIMLKGLSSGNALRTEYADVCHYIAAILNAASSVDAYGSTVSEVQEGLCKAMQSGQVNYYTTQLLAHLNERGCFMNAFGNCLQGFVLIDNECIPACPQSYHWDANQMTCVPN